MEENFDFHLEAAEIQPDMVKMLQVEVLEPSQHAKVTLTTLEETIYELDWTVHHGIQVTTLNGQPAPPEMEGRGYEDLNQFLQANSPMYQS